MYEEYMQNLLGMQMRPMQNTYEQDWMQEMYRNEIKDNCNYPCYNAMPYNYLNRNVMTNETEEIEKSYPEIYNMVYPMVRKACMENTRPVNQTLIDELTQEIYNNFETGDIINININTGTGENREVSSENNKIEVENRQSGPRNSLMNDLIKILLIRELQGRPNPPRPVPPRPMPPRPPMPRF